MSEAAPTTRPTGPEINRLQCAAAFLRSGCSPMPDYAADVEAAIRILTPSGVERIRESVFAGVKEQVEEASHDDSARWMTCSGCYEGVDGHNTHGFPYSEDFGCVLGGGCQECGGIGALWDTTDYAAMAEDMLRADRAALALPSEPPSQDVEGRARELLAAEYERAAGDFNETNLILDADDLRKGHASGSKKTDAALRALVKALASKEDGRS